MAITVQNKFSEVKQRFHRLFELFENHLNGQKTQEFHQSRKKAINRLDELEFPTRRNEEWKYTSVKPILNLAFQQGGFVQLNSDQIAPFCFEGLDVYRLVFVNGYLDRKNSNIEQLEKGLIIDDLAQALVDPESRAVVQELLEENAEKTTNPFVALNTAFSTNGIFVKIKRNQVIEKPIHILNITVTGEDPVFVNPQVVVVGERSSQATFLESFHVLENQGGTYFNNVVDRFLLEENAVINHYKIQQESTDAFQINNTEAHQARNSTYSNFAIDLGGKIVRNNLSSILQSEGTMTNLFGVYLISGQQHIDNQTFMDHAFPHCNSNELYKGIVTDKGRGVFNGKVIVRQDAQKTNAFQQNSSLVLAKTAQMDTKPQLEIYADDVKCSHGATIGQLDEDLVYYLRARGLNDEQARFLLQQAFLREVLENIKIDVVRERSEEMIFAKFDA